MQSHFTRLELRNNFLHVMEVHTEIYESNFPLSACIRPTSVKKAKNILKLNKQHATKGNLWMESALPFSIVTVTSFCKNHILTYACLKERGLCNVPFLKLFFFSRKIFIVHMSLTWMTFNVWKKKLYFARKIDFWSLANIVRKII